MKISTTRVLAVICAGLLAGCSDSSSESETRCTPEDLSQCAPNQVCSENGECVDAQKPVEVKCGNNVVDGTDWCDGSDLNNRTCGDFQGFIGGTLKCDSSCRFDTSACTECSDSADCANRADSKTVCENSICVMPPHCGDNIVNNDEECDGSEVSKTCQEMGFVGGVMTCNQNCKFDDSGCVECTKEDTSNCAENRICSDSGHCVDPGHEITCGDSLVEDDEECDTDKLNGKSCADMGFGAGTLKCSSSCVFDTSECVECDSDIHCAKRSDRKTKCENQVCVKPPVVNEPECTKDKPCKVGFYCHEDASMPELNKCEAQSVCEVNGCLDVQTLCYNVNWNTPGMAELCPKGCKDNKCTDTVCVTGMCNENAYCDTSNKTEGEWVDCGIDQTCSQGSCVKKAVEGMDSIVISQLYPGGGVTGSTFNVKYVELFNRGDVDVTLKNWSIQYASASTTSAQTSSSCLLPEQVTIPAHSYYLVSLKNDGGNLSPVSDYNCTRSIAAAQSNGRLFLVSGKNNISSAPAAGEYVDAVGYGTSKWAEGSAMEALSKTTAGLRKLGGCVDTNDNSKDFEIGVPIPRNSKSAKNTCQFVEENTEARCKDNIDNDGDSKIDCDDPGCSAFAFCHVENTAELCKDGTDNDGDGKKDCDDSDCASFCVENTAELCKDGLDNDGDGKKDCDDTDCAAFCQGKCGSDQTWLAEYEVCAWNISSASSLTSLKDEWNANGDTKYVIDAGKKVAFVLTKNIPLGNVDWEGIGTSTHPFNGIFYGNDYTISGQFSNTPGLFGNVKDAIIAHTKLSIQYRFTNDKTITNVGALAGYAENVTVNNVETNSGMNDVKNDGVNRNYGGLIGSGDGVFKDIKVSSSFDNKIYRHNMSGFICEANSNIQLTNIDVNSTLKTLGSFYFAGMIYKIKNTVSKVEINNANIVLNDYVCEKCISWDGDLYGILGECRAKNIVIDGLDLTIKKLSSDAARMFLIMHSNFEESSGPGSEKMSINRMRIRNLTDRSLGYFYNQSNLTVKNSDLGISDSYDLGVCRTGTWSNFTFYNSKFGTAYIYIFNSLYLYNSYYTKFSKSTEGSYSQFVFYDSIYQDTVTFTGNNSVKFESAEKTVKTLNENLKNSIYLPEGKYAPWALDASGNATLDLDAPADQWVEF